jgi:hypothetical protein
MRNGQGEAGGQAGTDTENEGMGRGERRRRARERREWSEAEADLNRSDDERDGAPPLATLKHVLGGECSGLTREERKETMKAIKEQLAKAMKAMKGAYRPGSGGGRCHETIARAYAGAVMAEKGAVMTTERWEALRQFASGCLPHWEAVDRKTGARVRGIVNEAIGYVHLCRVQWQMRWRRGERVQREGWHGSGRG